MKSLVAFVAVVVVLFLILLNIHIVRTETGMIFLRKLSIGLKDTYADLTMWEPSDLHEHRELVAALKAGKHGELVDALERKSLEEERLVPPWTAPAPSPEALRTATRTQTGSSSTQKRIRDRVKKEVDR